MVPGETPVGVWGLFTDPGLWGRPEDPRGCEPSWQRGRGRWCLVCVTLTSVAAPLARLVNQHSAVKPDDPVIISYLSHL